MSMLKIGDVVKHQKTGNIGKIIDYGYQKISDSYYLTTLRVELFTYSSMTSTVEDLFEQCFNTPSIISINYLINR